jgi:hypothetical protein
MSGRGNYDLLKIRELTAKMANKRRRKPDKNVRPGAFFDRGNDHLISSYGIGLRFEQALGGLIGASA